MTLPGHPFMSFLCCPESRLKYGVEVLASLEKTPDGH